MLISAGVADVICASVLFVAGFMKLGNLAAFGSQIGAYQVLPRRFSRLLGFLVPPAEIVVALAMIIAPKLSLLAAALFIAFGAAIGVNLLRGRTELLCSCFGVTGRHTISRLHLVGDVCLAVLAAMAYIEHPRPTFLAVQIGVSAVLLAVVVSAWGTMTAGSRPPRGEVT